MDKNKTKEKDLLSVIVKGFSNYPHINYKDNDFALIPEVLGTENISFDRL